MLPPVISYTKIRPHICFKLFLDPCRFLSWFTDDFFTGGSNILYTELLFTNNWIVSFVFCRCSLMDWSGVDYCDVLIICLDSHSDGTHSLQSIHCWTSDGRLHFSKSEAAANSSWMAWNYVWLNYSFKRISPKEWKLSLFTDWFMYHNPFLWLIFSPMSVHVVVTTVSDSHKPESGKIKHVCHIHISREESKETHLRCSTTN